jgi:hypothetical protein
LGSFSCLFISSLSSDISFWVSLSTLIILTVIFEIQYLLFLSLCCCLDP